MGLHLEPIVVSGEGGSKHRKYGENGGSNRVTLFWMTERSEKQLNKV